MNTSSMQTSSQSQEPQDETSIKTTASMKPLYYIGGVAALVQIIIIVIQAPILILYPQPTTVIGHFTQFQDNMLLGLLDLDLMLILAEVFSILILLALYAALRQASPSLMAVALIFGLFGTALFLAVNPTFSMLYLSDQYAAATTQAQKAIFLTAGEALWANYNGTAFGLFFIMDGIAYLLIAAAMWRSGIFGKATAATGIIMGAMLLVPPLPLFGALGLTFSYIVIVPSAIWDILIARRLFQLARLASR